MHRIRKSQLQDELERLSTNLKRMSDRYPPMKLLAAMTLTEALRDLTIPERQEEAMLFLQTDVASAVLEITFEDDRPPGERLQDIFDEIFEDPPQVVPASQPGEIIEYEEAPAVDTPVIELCLRGGQSVTFELQFVGRN